MLRPLLDLFIFFARHMVLTFASVLLICLIVARFRQSGRLFDGARFSSTGAKRSIAGLAILLILVFAGIGGWYISVNGFAGEVEPIVSCLSWLVQTGQPLYTDFDAAERYSVLYGPSVFLTNGLFLRVLGPTLASAKLASVFGTVGSLFFLYGALARKRRDRMALSVTALAVLYYWTQGFAVYLVRPDALLLFAVGLGLFAAVKARRVLALITVAVAAGFAINLKAHGLVYFAPIFGLVYQRFGTRDLLRIFLGTAVVVIAPFFLYPQVSLVNYVGWLTNAMSHGLEMDTLSRTFRYAGFLLLPVVCAFMASRDRRRLFAENKLAIVLLAPVYGLTVLLSAKPGAGPVHLLPLVPTTMYLLGSVYRASLTVRSQAVLARPAFTGMPVRQAVLTATVLTALLAGTVNAYRSVRYVDYQIAQIPGLAYDVQEIMATYPDLTISMACGGENQSFRATWLRPLLVFANHPMLIDPISVMDSSLSGRGISENTYRAISEGRIAVWLVPRKQIPFSKVNWYAPHNPLFPVKFREHFIAHYTPHGHSRYFDLWFWNGLPEIDAQMPHYADGVGVGGAAAEVEQAGM